MDTKQKPVNFSLRIFQGVDQMELKQKLEALARDQKLQLHIPEQMCIDKGAQSGRITVIIFGQTDKDTYERLFRAQIRYNENSNLWEEIRPATVPAPFTRKIIGIHLSEYGFMSENG